MLGTAIIAAAMTTGDTMSHTIRSSAIESLGQTDELVSAKGAEVDVGAELGAATGVSPVRRPRGHGVAPAIIEPIAVQDPERRQNEPRVTLFATDPARMAGFGTIARASDGHAVALGDLRPGEAFLNRHAADELHARAGDRLLVSRGRRAPAALRVRDVVRYDGAGTADSALMLPLAAAQGLLGAPGKAEHVLVSNRGGATSGAVRSDAVVARLAPVLAPLGLEADTTKQDAIRDADRAGSAFMAFFTTFGSFSIAAGILLIFLIFVMLAAERRGELGIAARDRHAPRSPRRPLPLRGRRLRRPRGARRRGARAVVAFAMVAVLAKALGTEGVDVRFDVTARSLVIASRSRPRGSAG